ncbi:hypothetical protein [Absidia glauca]|uniref:Endonuclease/exonuclease/phosphatase domain-containing protein n=1 Tax=Absidia glauca TaxID=4829 RepID=A0A168L3D7_ABSGL|nr:hypothetical protein [Absidia glauca]
MDILNTLPLTHQYSNNTIICGDLNGRLMETLGEITMTNTRGRLMQDWLQLNDILLWNGLLAKGQPTIYL